MAQPHRGQLGPEGLFGDLILGGEGVVLLRQLRLRHVQVFPPGNLRHSQLVPGGVLRLGAGVASQVVHGEARGVQIVLQRHALGGHVVFQLLQQPVQLVFDHGRGQGHRHVVDDLLHQGVGPLAIPLLGQAGQGVLHNVAAQGGGVGEVQGPGQGVVQLRHGAAGDGVALHLEHRVLARQLRRVLRGEGHLHVPLLPHGHACHLLLKAGDEHAAAQQQGILLPLAAGKGHAVQKALEVDGHLVAHGGLVRVLLHQVVLQKVPDGLLRVLGGQLHRAVGGGQALVLPQCHLRVQVDESGEGEAVAVDGVHVEGGGAGQLDVLRGDGVHQRLGVHGVHRLLVQEVAAVGRLQLLPCHLTVHREHGLYALIGVHQGLLPHVLFHLNGQLHLALLGQILAVQYGHRGMPPRQKSYPQYTGFRGRWQGAVVNKM